MSFIIVKGNFFNSESFFSSKTIFSAIISSSKFKTVLSSLYHFNLKNALLKLLLKKNYSAANDGLFRNHGEIHQWMYDRYSLKKILEENGFINLIQRSAFESYLLDWQKYFLDGENGKIRKPDSLFMEGIKPALYDGVLPHRPSAGKIGPVASEICRTAGGVGSHAAGLGARAPRAQRGCKDINQSRRATPNGAAQDRRVKTPTYNLSLQATPASCARGCA